MIRTTAEASSTRRVGCLAAISAIPILADQIFWRWIKPLASRLLGQGRQLHQGLSASLAGITATGLLQVAESLLVQAAPMAPSPELQDLVQWVGEIADLQGCYCGGREGMQDQARLMRMIFTCGMHARGGFVGGRLLARPSSRCGACSALADVPHHLDLPGQHRFIPQTKPDARRAARS